MITDKEISEQLYEAYYMKVYSFVMTLAKNKTLSEEITQEVFFRAITTEKTFRGESDTFTWLCAIAKNLFYDEMRKRSRQSKEVAVKLSDSGDDPAAAVADADASFRIHLVLHELEEPYKEVFELRCFGELSFKQIGTIFQKTESWARVTYHRAKLKIQERMDAI
ncbi:MAG: RNA polymerase sigma factor [Butyricicoccus sp.]